MILDKIITFKSNEIKSKKKKVSLSFLEELIDQRPPVKGFYKKIAAEGISLIAELKKASPSKGILREDFNPVDLAKRCIRAGAGALSVLTDERFFQGSLLYLEEVAAQVNVPALCKDFIIDEYQLFEARAYGADAILLLAGVLNGDQLAEFISRARSLNLDCLVEVHTLEELETVLTTEVGIIGINNRDLNDFTVDLKTTERLIRFIPKDKLVVSESGIFTAQDVVLLRDLGVRAVLIGEAIMTAGDIEAKIRELLKNVKD